MTKSIAWLQARAPGFNHLCGEEIDAISDFSLLWSLFESRILNADGSARAICYAVDRWRDEGTLNAAMLETELAYFRARYFEGGAVTHHFGHLHLSANALRDMVLAVIDGSNNDDRDRVVAVLMIVFRYRNNLFHGVKWQYKLAGQLENFTNANSALMKVLDRHGALKEG